MVARANIAACGTFKKLSLRRGCVLFALATFKMTFQLLKCIFSFKLPSQLLRCPLSLHSILAALFCALATGFHKLVRIFVYVCLFGFHRRELRRKVLHFSKWCYMSQSDAALPKAQEHLPNKYGLSYFSQTATTFPKAVLFSNF